MITATLNSTFCAGSAAACSKGVDNVIHNFAQFIIFTENLFLWVMCKLRCLNLV